MRKAVKVAEAVVSLKAQEDARADRTLAYIRQKRREAGALEAKLPMFKRVTKRVN